MYQTKETILFTNLHKTYFGVIVFLCLLNCISLGKIVPKSIFFKFIILIKKNEDFNVDVLVFF